MEAWKKYLAIGLIVALLLLVAVQATAQARRKVAASIMSDDRAWLEAAGRAFGRLDNTQQDSVKRIFQAFQQYGDGDYRKLAYILATAWHESKLKPIRELRAKSGTKLYEQQNRYWLSGYYGRGYVQLTWQSNYQKMGNALGINLENTPELALQAEYAARIIVYGMMEGSFTGKELGDYLSTWREDYYNARRVVNGTDRATLIKGYALSLKKEVEQWSNGEST